MSKENGTRTKPERGVATAELSRPSARSDRHLRGFASAGFLLIMDSILASKTAFCPPGLFFQPAGGIKGSQFNFNVGHAANFCKVYYPRRPSSYVAKRSRNDGRVLNEICWDEKILVANRGEIAVRVIRTAHEMGIPCVAVHSTIDRDALHVRLADDAVCIGEAPSSQSYLHIQNVLSAAVSRGCTMLHPGYGFLAENARFVDMCRGHGVNFIGPNPDSIRVMGDKSTARETMKKAGVPTVPGSDGLLQSTEEAVKLAHEIGFPVMIKATAGGGGRGMRLAKEPDEFVKLLQQAKSEAAAAFGNDGVYLEKYIQNPRHIEFQVSATSVECGPSKASEVRPKLPISGTMVPRYLKMEFPIYFGEGDPLGRVRYDLEAIQKPLTYPLWVAYEKQPSGRASKSEADRLGRRLPAAVPVPPRSDLEPPTTTIVECGNFPLGHRRNQKLLEEAPSPALTSELRKAMGDAAVAAAASIGYIGVGTVEFLLDERGSFYFMEMNTRIQVEHPVTEMISSTDLIEEQIRVALGERLTHKQEDIVLRGHSIECRINAEDAFKGFRPGPGTLLFLDS
ncbi:hypothetical protein ZIOFF_040490 [Zingiber officinale]|uniref:biotin carboxylase n=1 Tax=Zingiber officinale TaxID=94328 RepID=A0A8J5GHN3_ZINOF|nr:hypothetical protein ZIOFF_040490 [Zingiber officinale]